MKVSVIITTYNRPGSLVKVLDGLRHQTRTADEVIVADDGSGPDTSDALQRFMKGAPYPLYHIRHEDRGFRAAEIRNKAINKSSGSYIVSLDGDCIPDKHFISDHVLLAEKGFFYQGKRVIVSKGLSSMLTHREVNSLPMLFKYFISGKVSNAHHLIRLPMLPSWRSRRLGGIRSCNMGFFREDIFAVNGFNQDFVG
ncbi:glycosyltransferase, partial [Thermodesulfobacteriota bacterium]